MTPRTVALGYGRARLTAHVPRSARVLEVPEPPPASRPLEKILADALECPIGAPRLRGRVRAGARVTVVVSDGTRDEPRTELLAAVLAEMATDVRLTIAIANGTHAPGAVRDFGVTATVVNHDSRDDASFADLGHTPRGTRVRFPRWLCDQDLVIATGRIRPHYFAGFGAGTKAIFPGLGHHDDIRQNHRLKAEPSARLGRVDGNVCREDMEAACALLPVERFLINVVMDDAGKAHGAVAGEPLSAFRAGAELCRPLCEVAVGEPADVVITSEALPLSGSLYQASKLLAPAGLCLKPGGVAILAAECPDGTGPLDTVNEGIYRLGIRHCFPEAHTIYLVSSLPESVVAKTYCLYAPSVEWVLDRCMGNVLVLPSAGSVVPRL